MKRLMMRIDVVYHNVFTDDGKFIAYDVLEGNELPLQFLVRIILRLRTDLS
jgi:hypothetical protein